MIAARESSFHSLKQVQIVTPSKTQRVEAEIREGGAEAVSIAQVRSASGRLTYVLNVRRPGQSAQTLRLGDTRSLSLEQARAKATRIQGELLKAALESGFVAQKQQDLTFEAFIQQHYLSFIRQKQRSTSAAESYLRNWVIPTLGQNLLKDITKSEISFFLRSLEIAGLKAGSINRILNIVKSCFTKAIEWEFLNSTVSPAKGVSQVRDTAKKDRFLNQEEAQRLIALVQQSRNGMLFPIVGFLLTTGARRSEVLNARWQDIDVENHRWGVPLSKSGKPRTIPLSDASIGFLFEAKKAALSRHGRGPKPQSDFIFVNWRTGRAFSNIFNSWDLAREKAGLKDVRMHDLRHSFASSLVNNGMNIYDVKELLGHSSIQTTQRYAHLSQERLQMAAEKVSDHFGLTPAKRKPI